MSIAIPETYWLVPGKILAGSYPARRSRADTIRRLRALLAAGVTTFFDLTEQGEHVPYADLLDAMVEARRRRAQHIRKALVDHQVPLKPEIMLDILESLERAVKEEQCVYLHCRAGIGRTGMVAGCYLIHSGMSPHEALEHLNALWQESGRSAAWPQTPETEEQTEYVRRWGAPAGGSWWRRR